MIRCDGTKATITLFLNQLKRNNHPKKQTSLWRSPSEKSKNKTHVEFNATKIIFSSQENSARKT